jgi:uncharacterized protein (DUF1697 family)
MMRYVALLRGINVGGKNLIPMAELTSCLAALRLADVRTYIQSGNVLFGAKAADRARLTRRIEAALSATFGYEASVVVRSREELGRIVADAPRGFGTRPGTYRDDVIFLKEPLTADEALESVTTKPGVDRATAGPGVLYFSRLAARASQSRLTRITGTPVYKRMTIRNWNTTTALLRLLEAAD